MVNGCKTRKETKEKERFKCLYVATQKQNWKTSIQSDNPEMTELNSSLPLWNTAFFRKTNVSTCISSHWMSGPGSITSQVGA